MTGRTLTITGVHGFVGRHIAKQAKAQGFFVRGVSKDRDLDQVLAPHVDEYFSADLTKEFPVEALSDSIIHLAGLAAVGQSFQNPQFYIEVNSSMVTNICETILRESVENSTKVLGVSSGAVYGTKVNEEPIDESDSIVFSSPYVVSKVLIENQLQYYSTRGIHALIARPFNHIGPGQKLGFLLPDLLYKLINIGSEKTIGVGNLTTRRDYLDVRDIADAYVTLVSAQQHEHQIYNISSGSSKSGLDILASLCHKLNITMPRLALDRTRLRPSDASQIVGNSDRFKREFRWFPKISIDQTIGDFIDCEINSGSSHQKS